MKKIFLFLFLTILMSCGNGDESSKIAQLELDHSKTPTTDVKKQLLAAYKSYLGRDMELDSYIDYAQKKATLEVDLNQYQDAATTLANAIKKKASGENIGMLSNVLVNHLHKGNFTNAVTDIQKSFANPAELKSTFQPILKNLQQTMMDEKTGQWNRQQVLEYISMTRLQAAIVKKDEEVERSLLSAANMADAMKRYDDALVIYDYMLAHPDDFSKSSSALFFKGFIYDDRLKKIDDARKYYTEYLEKFPEGGYAESAQVSLKNLGKTAAEIIESFGK